MASKGDFQLASLAAGFTLGFGFFTVWEAIKQTKRNHRPWKSVYIYMIWGEVAANLGIGIIGWIFLDGVLSPTVPVLFSILVLWVLEIQLLMQIIINRIAIIAEHRSTINKLKWGTACTITCINISVFCIWIPSHLVPPVSELYVHINEVWDRISKILILFVDAGLNYYFLRTVKRRLVKQHGLTKYAPLVGFNAKLMVVSVLMDALLICLMSLPNQVVYIQFHPVTYMVKLNVELSMANLIMRLARGEGVAAAPQSTSYDHYNSRHDEERHEAPHLAMHSMHGPKMDAKGSSGADSESGSAEAASLPGKLSGVIHVETVIASTSTPTSRMDRKRPTVRRQPVEDELPLAHESGFET